LTGKAFNERGIVYKKTKKLIKEKEAEEKFHTSVVEERDLLFPMDHGVRLHMRPGMRQKFRRRSLCKWFMK
ncbi:hypothetical protein V4Y02_24010, partial [Escherichia coli]